MAKLLLFLQDGSAREVPLEKDKITIGRRHDCDVPLPYPTVSGRHALFSMNVSQEQCFVEDLKSTNGTLLNGVLLTEKKLLKDRDQVDIGGQKFVYLEGAPSSKFSKASKSEASSKSKKSASGKTESRQDKSASAPAAPGSLFHATTPQLARTTLPDADENTADPETFSGLHFPTIFRIPAKRRAEATDVNMDEALTFPSAVVDGGALLEEATHNLPEPVGVIEALSGPNSQRKLLLRQGEYVLGRPGFHLATVRVTGEGCFLVAMEGELPIKVGDRDVTAEGIKLEDGDMFTVAQSPLQFRVLPGNDGKK